MTWEQIADTWEADYPDVTPRVAFRWAHNISHLKVADRWNELEPGQPTMTKSRVYKFEAWPAGGGRRPSVASLRMLARIYHTTPRRLLTDNEHALYDDASRTEIARACQSPSWKSATTAAPESWGNAGLTALAGGKRAVDASEEAAGEAARRAADTNDDHDQPDGFDLWELNDALRGSRIGRERLALAEAACDRLDKGYAELSPHVVLPKISVRLRRTVRALRESQPVAHRRRLCALAGRLAGLRAWLLFDLADHQAANEWYDGAIQAAREAEDHALCGWLFGARSLIPSYQHDHPTALTLVEQGKAIAERSGDPTVLTWLHALDARGRAGARDNANFRAARRRADRLVTRTSSDDRRHGMDFDGDTIDLTYYAGTSHLLLGQPEAATEFLQQSLNTLPAAHTKAKAILLLGLATAAAQQRRVDEASELACQALTVAPSQPIMPILQRARDLRGQLASSKASSLAKVDERLDDFARGIGGPQAGPRL